MKSCLGVLFTFLVVVFSFALYVWIIHWNILDMPRKVLVPHLMATLGPNFLGFCVGLVYCWWALIFSESVKAFLTYQRFKHK